MFRRRSGSGLSRSTRVRRIWLRLAACTRYSGSDSGPTVAVQAGARSFERAASSSMIAAAIRADLGDHEMRGVVPG